MKKTLIQIRRLLKINITLAKYNIDKILISAGFYPSFRFLIYLNPWNWRVRHEMPRAVAIRRALEDLGPVFVKFGQALSIRRDLLPSDVIAELSLLQDAVAPFSTDKAKQIVNKELAKPLNELFLSFEDLPLASASIAQVHAAFLPSGQEVIVKIRRPHIEESIERDIHLMYTLAGLLEKYWHDGKRLRLKEVVAEFEKSIIAELDFTQEAANASQLRRNFLNSPLLYIPEIYWPYSREKVMVMERIRGIPIADMPALRAHNVNIKKLAERGVEIFFTQVFRDSFFHADMHPGNLFVSYNKPREPQYLAVDFGIMGTLTAFDQRYLAENLLAFFNRDYRLVAELHVESGWVAKGTRVDEFESAIRTVCEPIFERPLSDISFAQVLMRLFQTGRRFNMEIQPQLVLLQKTLLAIEGLGRHLYPELDLWHTAKPFLERWVSQQVGIKAFFRKSSNNLPFVLEKLPDITLLLHEVLVQAKQQLKNQPDFQAQLLILNMQQQQEKKRIYWRSATITLALASILSWFAGTQWWPNTVHLTTILGGLTGFMVLIMLFVYRK